MTKNKKRNWRLRFLIVLLLIGGFLWWQKGPGLGFLNAHAKPAVTKKPAFTVLPVWPKDVLAAAVGVEGYGPLAATGDDKQRPIASIAKVITALALLEKHPLKPGEEGPQIPITAKDEQLYRDYVAQNGTVVLVKAGTSMSLRDALEAMLLPSANNVADTAAIWQFKSLKNYHAYANDMLARRGLHETKTGGDASGLSPATKSTASDLVKLGELTLQNETIRSIMAQHAAEVPVAGVIPNYNKLVTQYGFTGIKPGDSIQAGNTILFSSTKNINGKKLNIIGAILGSNGYRESNAGALELVESVEKSIKPVAPASAP